MSADHRLAVTRADKVENISQSVRWLPFLRSPWQLEASLLALARRRRKLDPLGHHPPGGNLLTLYIDAYWISPYAFSAFVALREKELQFEVKTMDLSQKAQQDPQFQRWSVTGRIPALLHDEFGLAESSAIVEYLEEAFPDAPRLLPQQRQERARARQVMGWIRSDLMALREERSTHTMFYQHTDKPLSLAGDLARQRLIRVAEQLLPPNQPNLFAQWSIADADLAFMLQRLVLNGDSVPGRLKAYANAQWQRPSIQAFVHNERPVYVPY